MIGDCDADAANASTMSAVTAKYCRSIPTSRSTIGTIGRNSRCVRKNSFFVGALPTEIATMPAALAPFTPGRSRRRARNSRSSSSSCSSVVCSSVTLSAAEAVSSCSGASVIGFELVSSGSSASGTSFGFGLLLIFFILRVVRGQGKLIRKLFPLEPFPSAVVGSRGTPLLIWDRG